ncbi:hypothetical protein EJ05DRAFT_535939 [Pseudovirgaria hyperparasitica]|uniref:Oxidoreductase-like domain-containing protein n=1 Tax=Pseudovirgaria hyperparasitica TaxID=470096 RepID=A0A6A6WGK7_9PEZI|nr:uncharacterized protein EJ05DRAFT_535939 [Pseudovirgaria hyperparasitica]KAF2761096.1 hypothetical protein EJ05DRAFT_535939 [Pseudovirgaria hyperparasitica]
MEAFIGRTRASLISSCRLCSACRSRIISSRLVRLNARCDMAQRRLKGNIAAPGEQAQPLQGFYADLLENPVHSAQNRTRSQPAPLPPDDLSMNEKDERLRRARVVFGSRLAGPREREDQLRRESTTIAGVIVPPRPSEPDNCCMSGCVNCVWDRYRDELEDWAAASAEARVKLQSQSGEQVTEEIGTAPATPLHAAVNKDDDGGRRDTNWTASEDSSADLFSDIPVGIREFMRMEKKLKQRHQQERVLEG